MIGQSKINERSPDMALYRMLLLNLIQFFINSL